MNDEAAISKLRDHARAIALKALELHKKANSGHIGASLSCLDILTYIFFELKKQNDLVILSKGHAASALYSVLDHANLLPKHEIDTFYTDNTNLAAHPPCSGVFPAIPFGTGSLGHGLGLACGLALGARMQNDSRKVYVVLSDGELNEGSTWEALMFAVHHQLKNLVVFLDKNGIQGIDFTKSVLNLDRIGSVLKTLGADVAEVDQGNDFAEIRSGFLSVEKGDGPKLVVCRTTKGSGVSFMENTVAWHYLPMSDEQYRQAISDITGKYA